MSADGADLFDSRLHRVKHAYEQVADQLRDLILQEDLAPGDRLPSETQLTKVFGVSRSTVREALRTLASQQLIVTKRGKGGGTFIAHPEEHRMTDVLQSGLRLLTAAKTVSLEDLLEMRTILEAAAAPLAAQRRTEEHLTQLAAFLPSPANVAAGRSFEGTASFHLTLFAASHNSLLEMLARPIFGVLRTQFLRDRAPRRFWEKVADDHKEILAAVTDQDPGLAASLTREHLSLVGEGYALMNRDAVSDRAG